jgi:hypothetical protein
MKSQRRPDMNLPQCRVFQIARRDDYYLCGKTRRIEKKRRSA